MNIKNALLIARHDYYKWLHKIRVAKFLGQKKGKLFAIKNVTPPCHPWKNISFFRFEDDPDTEDKINFIADEKCGFTIMPENPLLKKGSIRPFINDD